MNKIQRITLGLALLATLTCGGVGASAKNGGSKQRALSGVVQSVDLRARTIEVREQQSGRTITVRIPEGAAVQTASGTQRIVQIERLLPGMTIRDVVVE